MCTAKENYITYNEALKISNADLIPVISKLYGLEGYEFIHIERDYTAPNIVYRCKGNKPKILRISFPDNRHRRANDYLAETEYIKYLHDNGGSAADIISSVNGNLVEAITCGGHTFYICLFEKAKGRLMVENQYKYRDGVPVSEYYYNCGKVLGQIHRLSKEYKPNHRRYSFFDKYNAAIINEIVPASLSLLKQKLNHILDELEKLPRDAGLYGMLHFDFNDGNFAVDFDTDSV